MSLIYDPSKLLLHQDDVNTDSAESTDACDVGDHFNYQSPRQTSHNYYGLPYQDHNYGAPPPPTPPASPDPMGQSPLKVNGHIDIENVSCNTEVVTCGTVEQAPLGTAVDDSVTRCICDFDHDDGYMVCCDKCGVWQHVDCMELDRAHMPDEYYCEKCEPRKIHKQRAVQLQTKKRQFFLIDTSATETEDETKKSPLQKKARGRKKKFEKKENKLAKKGNKKKEKRKSFLANKKQKLNAAATKKALKFPKSPQLSNPLSTPPHAPEPMDDEDEEEDVKVDVESSKRSDGKERPRNEYSVDMQKMLAPRRFNGTYSSSASCRPSLELLEQLCTVSTYDGDVKGLEVTQDVDSERPVIEYTGKVMLQAQYEKDNAYCIGLNRHVLFYNKFDNTDICVDATNYAGDAKHVRRSCHANAEVRHLVENGAVHFFIYPTKFISRGSEITIPFDFKYQNSSYEVQCACNRASCPVAKFYKKEPHLLSPKKEPPPSPVKELPSPPALPTRAAKKKKRSSKSVSECESTPKEATSPVKTQPPFKRRRVSPLRVSIATDVPMKEKPQEPKTPVKEHSKAVSAPVTPGCSGLLSPLAEENEEEEKERKKKMTRDERKMEAIMKAFERMEKREERRKEALARMDHQRKSTGNDSSDQEGPHSMDDIKLEVKEEPPPPPPPPKAAPKEHKPKKGKKKTPARRRSRVSSSVSVSESNLSAQSADESTVPNTPVSAPVETVPLPVTPPHQSFKFHKTKKQQKIAELMNEKSQDGSTPSRTESLEINAEQEEEAEFVKCLSSPHTDSLSHLRRNSVTGPSYPVKPSTPASQSQPDVTQSGGIQSAKKRWLRQAMYERSDTPSTGPPIGSMSPNASHCVASSPNTSPPVDFVTPLKKRWARGSISAESPYPPTPTTPNPYITGSTEDTDSTVKEEFRVPNGYLSPQPGPSFPQADNIFEKLSTAHSSGIKDEKEEKPNISDSSKIKVESCEVTQTVQTDNIKTEVKGELQSTITDDIVNTKTEALDFSHFHKRYRKKNCVEAFASSIASNTKHEDVKPELKATLCEADSVPSQSELTEQADSKESIKVESTTSAVINAVESENKISDSSDVSLVSASCSCVASTDDLHQDILVSSGMERTESVDVSSCKDSDSSNSVSEHARTCSSSTEDNVKGNDLVHTSHIEGDSSDKMEVDSSVVESPSLQTEVVCVSSNTDHETETTAIGSSTSAVNCVESQSVSIGPGHSSAKDTCQSESETGRIHLLSEGELDTSFSADTSFEANEPTKAPSRSDENGVSCSVAACGHESVTASTAVKSDVETETEEGEIAGTPRRKPVDSEKEEGEITSDDEDEPVVNTAPVTNIKVETAITSSAQTKADSTPSTSSFSPAFRRGSYSSEVSSTYSSSTALPNSPFWDRSPYSSGYKRDSWRRKGSSNHSSNTASSSHGDQSRSRKSISPSSTSRDSVDSRDGREEPESVSSTVNDNASDKMSALSCTVSHTEDITSSTASSSLCSPPGEGPISPGLTNSATKKKLSLLDYRKRMKHRSHDEGSSSSSSNVSSNRPSAPPSRTTSRHASTDNSPQLNATALSALPMSLLMGGLDKNAILAASSFSINMDTVKAALKAVKSNPPLPEKTAPPPPPSMPKKKDPEWSNTPTMAERVREQTQLSLTERLRREFGLETTSDDDERKDDDEPPPPPPPPPPKASSSPQVSGPHSTFHASTGATHNPTVLHPPQQPSVPMQPTLPSPTGQRLPFVNPNQPSPVRQSTPGLLPSPVGSMMSAPTMVPPPIQTSMTGLLPTPPGTPQVSQGAGLLPTPPGTLNGPSGQQSNQVMHPTPNGPGINMVPPSSQPCMVPPPTVIPPPPTHGLPHQTPPVTPLGLPPPPSFSQQNAVRPVPGAVDADMRSLMGMPPGFQNKQFNDAKYPSQEDSVDHKLGSQANKPQLLSNPAANYSQQFSQQFSTPAPTQTAFHHPPPLPLPPVSSHNSEQSQLSPPIRAPHPPRPQMMVNYNHGYPSQNNAPYRPQH